MPTTFPRRQVSKQGRGVKLALAGALLIEGVTLATAVADGVTKVVASAAMPLHEQAIAQTLAAMLSP